MSSAVGDPVLDTLMLPFVDGTLAWPDDGVLFLRARDGAALHERALPGLVCEQSFKPDADALQRSGLLVRAATSAGDGGAAAETRCYALVLLLPPRQRDEARALFAEALARLQPGGRIVAGMANDAGAKSGETDLARLAGPLASRSKNKCRVFWTQATGALAADGAVGDAALSDAAVNATALAAQWRVLDAPRAIADGRFVSRPGVFAWNRIDAATALLASQLPADLAGRAADLGAGYGALAVALLQRCAGITALDLFEAEARALDLARINLAAFNDQAALAFHWHDVTTDLPQRYDVIVMNPPFHAQGSADRPDIGRRFIAAAAEALKPGGRLWLVANRHLPYESVLDSSFGSVRLVAQHDGFKVVEAIKAGGATSRRDADTAKPPARRARSAPSRSAWRRDLE